MAITSLPVNPNQNVGELGKDFFLYIDTDQSSSGTPVWTLVGGQRNASLNRSADSIDVTHKTSGGWSVTKAGLRTWSIDLDSIYILCDDGIQALEYAFLNGLEVHVKLEWPDKSYHSGWGSITDFSLDTPHDGEATISGTINGNGALTQTAV